MIGPKGENRVTARDRLISEVARMSADGMTQAQIANELGVSQPTVGNYLKKAREVAAENVVADSELAEARRLSRRTGLPDLPAPRRDELGRQQCAVEDCETPRTHPMDVCSDHADSPEAAAGAKVSLVGLVNPAIRRLGELVGSQDERVALQASTAILDRTGYGKQVEIQVTDAREVLFEQLRRARDEYLEGEVVAEQIESPSVDDEDGDA